MDSRFFIRIGSVALLAVLIMSVSNAAAQTDGSLDASSRAQLAAIPLDASEMPSGYVLQGEGFLSAGGDLESIGFVGMYMSIYEESDGDGEISTYASMWNDAAAAEEGFALLEGGEEGVTQESLDAGDGVSELSVADGFRDATFTVDRFIVGVSVEGGSVDDEGLTSLVEAAEDRATSVIDGNAPDGVDLELPARAIDTGTFGSELRSGYVTSAEAEALYGVRGSSLGGLESSWVSLAATGEEGAGPFVTVAVSTFGDAENAARVVDQAAELVPLSIDLQPVDGVSVDGAEAVRAFQYASNGGDAVDSARVVMHAGGVVTVVDVQGASGSDAALSAVQSLATSQLACLSEVCEAPELSLGG